MIDVVFPKDNEEEFIRIAVRLNIKGLVFVYDSPKKFYQGKNSSVKVYNGLEISEKNKNLRHLADIVFVHGSDVDNRSIVESLKPDVLYSAEGSRSKDFIHQRASGLNHIIADIAKSKGVIVGFNFSELLKDNNLGLRIGRIMQNILLARKFKLKVCVASFAHHPFEMRSFQDLKAFFETVGMSDSESKNIFVSVKERLELNLKKKSGSYLAEGLEIV